MEWLVARRRVSVTSVLRPIKFSIISRAKAQCRMTQIQSLDGVYNDDNKQRYRSF